jgi:hypothetical protein
VTEAAVKQHLLRLYQKFRVPEGPNRRTRLANEVVALGLVKPVPLSDAGESSGGPASSSGGPASSSGGPASSSGGPASSSGGPASGVPEQPVRRRREQAP